MVKKKDNLVVMLLDIGSSPKTPERWLELVLEWAGTDAKDYVLPSDSAAADSALALAFYGVAQKDIDALKTPYESRSMNGTARSRVQKEQCKSTSRRSA